MFGSHVLQVDEHVACRAEWSRPSAVTHGTKAEGLILHRATTTADHDPPDVEAA
jgi:hypothetical protein